MSITLEISDDALNTLKEVAQMQRKTLEDVAAGVLEKHIKPERDEEFRRIAAYVMDKNAELYRRLA